MLGIIIGVASVISMIAIGEGSKQSIQRELSSMGSNMITIRPNSNTASGSGVRLGAGVLQILKVDDVEAIGENAILVTAVSPVVSTGGQAINAALNWPTAMHGGSPSYLQIREWKLHHGLSFTDRDVKLAAKVCLLGQTVVDNIFTDGENPVGKTIRFNKIPFKVIGVLEKKGVNTFGQDQDDIIIAPYSTVQKRILSTMYLQSIYASAKDENSSDSAASEIAVILRKQHHIRKNENDDFTIRTQTQLISTMSSTSELLSVLLAVIAGISLVVGGIGIMNIMYVSVTERTKEIGLRLSIGARSMDILLQFLIEAIFISVTGGIMGIVLGMMASRLVTVFLSWPTFITASSIILSFAVCVLTGVFFGYYPAQKASRLNPIDALRYE